MKYRKCGKCGKEWKCNFDECVSTRCFCKKCLGKTMSVEDLSMYKSCFPKIRKPPWRIA